MSQRDAGHLPVRFSCPDRYGRLGRRCATAADEDVANSTTRVDYFGIRAGGSHRSGSNRIMIRKLVPYVVFDRGAVGDVVEDRFAPALSDESARWSGKGRVLSRRTRIRRPRDGSRITTLSVSACRIAEPRRGRYDGISIQIRSRCFLKKAVPVPSGRRRMISSAHRAPHGEHPPSTGCSGFGRTKSIRYPYSVLWGGRVESGGSKAIGHILFSKGGQHSSLRRLAPRLGNRRARHRSEKRTRRSAPALETWSGSRSAAGVNERTLEALRARLTETFRPRSPPSCVSGPEGMGYPRPLRRP